MTHPHGRRLARLRMGALHLSLGVSTTCRSRTVYGDGEKSFQPAGWPLGGSVRVAPNRVALVFAFLAGGAVLMLPPGGPANASAAAKSTLTILTGVSCTGRTACTAVGYSDTDPPKLTTLAERWNGRKWAIERTPSQRGIAQLNGVSCAARKACMAAGQTETPDLPSLVERWNGRKWAIQRSPERNSSAGIILYGVSCSSPAACTAVGLGGSPPGGQFPASLALRWNGKKWSIQHVPYQSVPSGGTYLSAVSCASQRSCTAVGFVGNTEIAEGQVPLAVRWNGRKWAVKLTPIPADTNNTNLNGVSCVSPDACTAVGYAANSSGVGTITLAEKWNGKKWSIQPTPNPGDLGDEATLDAVSCASRKACTAVGDYYNPVTSATESLAESWNGKKWTIQDSYNPPGHGVYLYAVSCASPTTCTAVGRAFAGTVSGWTSLAERWNGTKWTRQPTPNP